MIVRIRVAKEHRTDASALAHAFKRWGLCTNASALARAIKRWGLCTNASALAHPCARGGTVHPVHKKARDCGL